jgi:hypothetical protein
MGAPNLLLCAEQLAWKRQYVYKCLEHSCKVGPNLNWYAPVHFEGRGEWRPDSTILTTGWDSSLVVLAALSLALSGNRICCTFGFARS